MNRDRNLDESSKLNLLAGHRRTKAITEMCDERAMEWLADTHELTLTPEPMLAKETTSVKVLLASLKTSDNKYGQGTCRAQMPLRFE